MRKPKMYSIYMFNQTSIRIDILKKKVYILQIMLYNVVGKIWRLARDFQLTE